MSKVLVFGHQNPDNDAIMSAVVLTQLLNQVNYNGDTYEARRLGPLPAESAKLLADNGIAEPELLESVEEGQQVVLTDHNEAGQSVAGLEGAQIVGVVDHHRFGGFTTAAPLHIISLPWGSSCCIVARLFEVFGQQPTDAQAKLLLSAMMTDTLMLKSPTTTDVDRAVAARLGEQLGVDPVKFGMEVFLEAMRAYQAEKGADGIVLCLTDIMEEGSQVLFEGKTDVAQKGLGIDDVPEGVWMPGVLSRKKQVAAPILAAAE